MGPPNLENDKGCTVRSLSAVLLPTGPRHAPLRPGDSPPSLGTFPGRHWLLADSCE